MSCEEKCKNCYSCPWAPHIELHFDSCSKLLVMPVYIFMPTSAVTIADLMVDGNQGHITVSFAKDLHLQRFV